MVFSFLLTGFQQKIPGVSRPFCKIVENFAK